MKRYLVPIEVEVLATSLEDAEQNVIGLMQHAFETSNDEDRFQQYRLHETSDTIQLS